MQRRFVAVSDMAGLQLYMIGLVVEDMEAALAFYGRLQTQTLQLAAK
ncbi:hypothetical protein BH23ACT4_BH23ACT4_11250 [soil metagenome]